MGETPRHEYEVVVVGGGPAGMTAALYSTRLGHETAVVSRGGGRAAMMKEVHNLLGVTEETSGMAFLQIGTEQLEDYGCRQPGGLQLAFEKRGVSAVSPGGFCVSKPTSVSSVSASRSRSMKDAGGGVSVIGVVPSSDQ